METLDFLGSLGSNHLGSTQEVPRKSPQIYKQSPIGSRPEYINKVL